MSKRNLNYTAELKKFVTSQYIYSGIRIALAIVVPAVIFAHFGILKQFFLFPLGTSFVGLTDMPGPFVRRRNALIFAVLSFTFVAAVASVLKDYPVLIFAELIVFGIFFTMMGVYGQRLASLGGLSLVVLSIFVDGHLSGGNILYSLLVFSAGCFWFLLVFLVVTKLQPYKLASQMIGENYLFLADYLRLKAKFYLKDADYDQLYRDVIAKQVVIKNIQEETREVVFKTRQIVNESTTVSRLLMLMFLNSIDLYEKLITTDQDYRKVHNSFDATGILDNIHDFLMKLADDLTEIGIALQSGRKVSPKTDIDAALDALFTQYISLRERGLSPETMENFMALRLLLFRVKEAAAEVKTTFTILSQDVRNAKSLSTGLDFEKFVPSQEKLNHTVFINNFSLKSGHFRHAVRLTTALLIGYAVSKLSFLGIGHAYWILITIVAIMRPAYSTTKYRNRLRIYGTITGAVAAYLILIFIQSDAVLLTVLFISMVLCFSFLKDHYAWAVFFMTIYIFITFNFMNPGNVNLIFKDRLLDTFIAGVIAAMVSYFIFPVWERSQNLNLMKKSLVANKLYFETVVARLTLGTTSDEQYRIRRKDAVISLANLSDNFQRMLSDPKNQQNKMTVVHQFVNTSHLVTAYTASLAQHGNTQNIFKEIDWSGWQRKITAELDKTQRYFDEEQAPQESFKQIIPNDEVEELLQLRKSEIEAQSDPVFADQNSISRLAALRNIREILELLYDVVHEQRRVIENFYKISEQG